VSDKEITLEDAERSSASLAANILLHALGWSYGGLHAMACEIVSQRDALRAELAEARQERDLLREFMRDACAALECEQDDAAVGLAIESLRVELADVRRDVEALKQELREATEACGDPSVNLTRTLPECIRALETERKALMHAVMEVRSIMHACGRRPETCHEMSILDDAIDAAREETP
jgi:hypothetical protein